MFSARSFLIGAALAFCGGALSVVGLFHFTLTQVLK